MPTDEKTMIPMSIRVDSDIHTFISDIAKTEERSMTYIINRLLRFAIQLKNAEITKLPEKKPEVEINTNQNHS